MFGTNPMLLRTPAQVLINTTLTLPLYHALDPCCLIIHLCLCHNHTTCCMLYKQFVDEQLSLMYEQVLYTVLLNLAKAKGKAIWVANALEF
jgi:hypothetical protein